MRKSSEIPPPDPRRPSEDETAAPQSQTGETQFSVETEETLEDEIDGDEPIDYTNPIDGKAPLRIEEECKNGRFKRVFVSEFILLA